MKKNGFTLIELLGVITILVMLGVIIIPVITNVISDNKKNLYDVQIRNIKSAASSFVADNVLSVDISDSIGIRLGKLKELGYVDSNISDPITKTRFSDDLLIIISNSDSGYSYVVCDGTVSCDTNVDVYGE